MYTMRDLYELLKRKGYTVNATKVRAHEDHIPFSMLCIDKSVTKDNIPGSDKYIVYVFAAADTQQELLVLCRSAVYEYYSTICEDVVHKPIRHLSFEYEYIDEWDGYKISDNDTLINITDKTIHNIEALEDYDENDCE